MKCRKKSRLYIIYLFVCNGSVRRMIPSPLFKIWYLGNLAENLVERTLMMARTHVLCYAIV